MNGQIFENFPFGGRDKVQQDNKLEKDVKDNLENLSSIEEIPTKTVKNKKMKKFMKFFKKVIVPILVFIPAYLNSRANFNRSTRVMNSWG